MTLRRIRLELARTPEFPEGSALRGYDFTAPLDEHGRIDHKEWERYRGACTVHRFWEGQDNEQGVLARTKAGRWVFSYAPGEDDDEPIFRLASHRFVEGEYLSITEHDGVARPFRVVAVKKAAVTP